MLHRTRHLLDRLGLGPAPGDRTRLEAVGVEGYIESQLHPETVPEAPSLRERLAPLETLPLTAPELFARYAFHPGPKAKRDPKAAQAARKRARIVLQQAVTARLFRALYSRRQLQEAMVDFWYNHFNVFAGKGLDQLWVGAYEQEAIRPHVFGRFRDLLLATARHPAMLFYLDNWLNTAPGSPGAHGRFDGINENYAREVMELHTLGVNGGYHQDDVIALAHILTGWGMRAPEGFHFDARRHDYTPQIFMRHRIPGGGEEEGVATLERLAAHPSTARHLAYQLAQYFVADVPPPSLVQRLADTYQRRDGEIRAVLHTLFRSPEFWDERYAKAKFKTPYRFVVSAVRACGLEVTDPRPLAGFLYRMGMPLYGCQTPNGYRNTQEAWLNPDGMILRLNLATALAAGRPRLAPDRPAPGPVSAAALLDTIGGTLSTETRSALEQAPVALRTAVVLGSPEFMLA
ncbi:MAG: hypothetical protein B7Z66_11405 [Chromatiales bacterium 21-64-14]|nr:MAG: hypothetical protein B7Z66_11405 [Chromatiales bacterium 21-64-14]HQU17382.1 DUF1800 domain-containing protein [Gammaproteobacteria bacterium]